MSAFGSGVDGGVGVEGTDWFPAGVSVLCAALLHALKANVLKSMAVHIHTCKIFLFIKPPLWLVVNNKKLADDNFKKEICQSIVFFSLFFFLCTCVVGDIVSVMIEVVYKFSILSTIIEIVLILSIVSTIIESVSVLINLSITVEIDKELAYGSYYQTEVHKADCAICRQAGY